MSDLSQPFTDGVEERDACSSFSRAWGDPTHELV